MEQKAAFVGLATWDIIYVVDHLPADDEKVVALDSAMNAGGPATNAAVTFAGLGGQSRLVSLFGSGPLAAAMMGDLQSNNVICQDIAPTDDFHPPVSSVFVTKGSASRAVVSLNGSKIAHTAAWEPEKVLSGCRLLLVDGHYMDAALCAAEWAASVGIPVLLDGGSWKEGTGILLNFCDMVIASSRFLPPGCSAKLDVLDYLTAAGIRQSAITDGDRPIFLKDGHTVESMPTHFSHGVDTTGAGDVFHGAFAYHLLAGSGFKASLREASRVAAHKCNYLGARSWLDALPAP